MPISPHHIARSFLASALAASLALSAAPATARADQQPRPGEQARSLRITLVDPGESPRTPLRRSFEVGQTGAFSLEMVSELHQKANDLDLPLQRMPMTRIELHSKVMQVHEDASASVRFTIADTEIDEPSLEGLDPALAAAAKRDMAAIKGAEITYSVSSRGVLSNPGVILRGGAELTSSAQQQLQQFQRALEQIVIPLPEDPVGIGARWRVSTPIDLGGIDATRSIEYQLIERHEAGRLELAFTITVAAHEQRITNTNIPAGSELHLTELAGTGDGVGLLEPNAAVATRVTWRVAVNRKHLYRVPITGQRTPREDRLDFLSVSATTAARLPDPAKPKPKAE